MKARRLAFGFGVHESFGHHGAAQPNIVYEAAGNRSLQTWAALIIGPAVADTVRGRKRNYVGNIMEHLA